MSEPGTANEAAILGVLLAGGLARRMGGGDKALIELAGRPLIEHVIERVRPQVARLIVNANGEPGRFARFGLPVVGDVVGGFAGPLAGVLTGMEWARENAPEAEWIATFATDAPFVPDDLVARMRAALETAAADMASVRSGARSHPVFGLWPVRLAGELRDALTVDDERKIDRWTARYRLAEAAYGSDGLDPFFNVNRPEDLAAAEAALAGGEAEAGAA